MKGRKFAAGGIERCSGARDSEVLETPFLSMLFKK
jgi:hypothetical protein